MKSATETHIKTLKYCKGADIIPSVKPAFVGQKDTAVYIVWSQTDRANGSFTTRLLGSTLSDNKETEKISYKSVAGTTEKLYLSDKNSRQIFCIQNNPAEGTMTIRYISAKDEMYTLTGIHPALVSITGLVRPIVTPDKQTIIFGDLGWTPEAEEVFQSTGVHKHFRK